MGISAPCHAPDGGSLVNTRFGKSPKYKYPPDGQASISSELRRLGCRTLEDGEVEDCPIGLGNVQSASQGEDLEQPGFVEVATGEEWLTNEISLCATPVVVREHNSTIGSRTEVA